MSTGYLEDAPCFVEWLEEIETYEKMPPEEQGLMRTRLWVEVCERENCYQNPIDSSECPCEAYKTGAEELLHEYHWRTAGKYDQE